MFLFKEHASVLCLALKRGVEFMDISCVENVFNSEDAILLAAMCHQANLIFKEGKEEPMT